MQLEKQDVVPKAHDPLTHPSRELVYMWFACSELRRTACEDPENGEPLKVKNRGGLTRELWRAWQPALQQLQKVRATAEFVLIQAMRRPPRNFRSRDPWSAAAYAASSDGQLPGSHTSSTAIVSTVAGSTVRIGQRPY